MKKHKIKDRPRPGEQVGNKLVSRAGRRGPRASTSTGARVAVAAAAAAAVASGGGDCDAASSSRENESAPSGAMQRRGGPGAGMTAARGVRGGSAGT